MESPETGKVAFPEPDPIFAAPWSVKKALGLLAVFGPAAILASVSIGAGETIVVVRAGSWAGYELLWLVLSSCIIKGIFVTYLLGRYTAVSGEHIGHRLARLPGPRGWLPLLVLGLEMAAAPLAWVPIARPCGDLIQYLFQGILPPGDPALWAKLFSSALILLALALGTTITYQMLEKQQIAICCILVAGTAIGTLLVRPDLAQALTGSLSIGRLPDFPPWAPENAVRHPLLTMATTFGYVGGGVISYVAYANWVGLRRWGLTGHARIEAIRQHAFTRPAIDYLPDDPAQVERMRRSLSPLRWDVGMGALVLFVVTAAFMISGAAVLYPMLESGRLAAGFQQWSLLTDQAHVWRAIHPSLQWVYYITVIAALWGTLQALPEIYARVTQEFFQAVWPKRAWEYRRIQRVIALYLFVVTTLLIWNNVPFDILIEIAGFLLANLAIALIMLAALYLNFKLPASYQVRFPFLIGGVLASAVLLLFAAISGWGLAAKLLGS
jgi:Mn2+/Fe2+ NRAMP family transporter